jgi:hypothetical protein
LVCFSAVLTAGSTLTRAAGDVSGASTPAELVASYNSLADTILAGNRTEHNLVKAILSATYRHGEMALKAAKSSIKSGQGAKGDIEKLAAFVSQLGNEGDASVAGIRTRLLEGGHHHNAKGEQQGLFDEGYVIVTRAAKKALLDSAMRIGKLAMAPDAKALDTEWAAVTRQYNEIMK